MKLLKLQGIPNLALTILIIPVNGKWLYAEKFIPVFYGVMRMCTSLFNLEIKLLNMNTLHVFSI